MISSETLEKLRLYKKIMIQVPEGLKMRLLELTDFLENKGFQTLVSVEPMFGGCDLRDREAKALGCDALLHIGHSDFGVKPQLPVIYEPYEIQIDPIPLLQKHLAALPYKTIALVTTINFQSVLEPAQRFLESSGKKILLGTQQRSGGTGTILGCDWTAAQSLDPDCFLYIGSGTFHPLGLAQAVNKPVLALDIETGELNNYEKEKQRLQSIKAFHKEEAKTAKVFGLLVSTKPGQQYIQTAENIKQALEDKGKKAYILTADFLSPDKLLGLPIDILVNCACPRISEDSKLFKKPILNPEDLTALLL